MLGEKKKGGMIQRHYIYCALHIYYYYISSTSDHQALDPGGWGPLPWSWISIEDLISQSVQSLSHVRLFVTPWTAACQAFLSITNSWSLFKLVFIELVMPSNRLILCHPLLLLPSIFPSIRVFSNE